MHVEKFGDGECDECAAAGYGGVGGFGLGVRDGMGMGWDGGGFLGVVNM